MPALFPSIEDGFEVHDHFDGSTQKRAAAWLSEHGIKRIFNADGHFAKDISRDVGHVGRRAIHGHGPLLWHL